MKLLGREQSKNVQNRSQLESAIIALEAVNSDLTEHLYESMVQSQVNTRDTALAQKELGSKGFGGMEGSDTSIPGLLDFMRTKFGQDSEADLKTWPGRDRKIGFFDALSSVFGDGMDWKLADTVGGEQWRKNLKKHKAENHR